MCYRHKALTFQTILKTLIKQEPLCYIDIGARGKLGEPWFTLKKQQVPMQVVGFEPDAPACEDLNRKAAPGELFLPTALWNKKENVPIHLCGAASSIHPPDLDMLRARYAPKHWKQREWKDIAQVPADRMDDVFAAHHVQTDFIKCDTQGAEFEIFEGGAKTLRDDVIGIIAETWVIPVHKGQKVSHEVEAQLASYGFILMQKEDHGPWMSAQSKALSEKPHVVQYNALWLKDSSLLVENAKTPEKLFKAAALADLFGHTGYALAVLAAGAKKFPARQSDFSALETSIKNNRKPGFLGYSLARAVLEKTMRRLGFNFAHTPPLAG